MYKEKRENMFFSTLVKKYYQVGEYKIIGNPPRVHAKWKIYRDIFDIYEIKALFCMKKLQMPKTMPNFAQ